MASILPILLAALVQTLGEFGFDAGWESPWALPWLAALPYLLARGARASMTRGRFRRSERWTALVRLSGALAFAAAVLGCGWIETVRGLTGARLDAMGWPEPELFLCLAPFVLYQVCALHAEVALHSAPGPGRRRLFTFQLRGFVLVLAPIAFYLGASSAAGLDPEARAWLENVSLLRGAFVAAVVVAVALLLPFLLRRIWSTEPLPDGPARRLLEQVGRKARFRPSEWLVWRTGGSMANAAVVGFVPWGRMVLFTDDLLAMLGARELVAVVAHEIGHAKRWHSWILISWAMALVLLGARLTDFALVHSDWAALAVFVALLGLGALGFGFLSRRLELDADLFCAGLTYDAPALASALRRVDGGYDRDGWRHFSSARRTAFLAEMLAFPERAERFAQRVKRWGFTGAALALLALGFEAHALVGALPLERVDASFALGHYDDARTLVARLDERKVDPELHDDLQHAIAAIDGLANGAPVAELEERLGARLEEAEAALGEAWALAALGAARGARHLDPVADALDALRSGEVERADAALAGVGERWREPLARLVEASTGTE